MNIFFVIKTPYGIEIVTPSLERGDILPGITRESVLEITRYWSTYSNQSTTQSTNQSTTIPCTTQPTATAIVQPTATTQATDQLTTTVPIIAFSTNPVPHMGTIKVSERSITMSEIQQIAHEGNLLEIFGTGTAATIYPVKSIMYNNTEVNIPGSHEGLGPIAKALWKVLTDIQYGKIEHPWAVTI